MAIYHYSVQVISRSDGRSAVAAAAYRSGEKLVDERTNESKFYVRDVQPETSILAPENAPEWVKDRQRLWNEVEQAEKRKDAQLCREINVALPLELNPEQQRELIKDFVNDQFVQKGMIADLAIHRDDPNNPHAHVMLTMRHIDENGFGKKNRDWNNRTELESGREEWANYANRALEKAGQQERITHLSHQARGIEQLPTVHLGHTINAMEQRGVQTDRGDMNRERQEYNRVVADLDKYREEKKAIEQRQKAEKFFTPSEHVELQKAANLLKEPATIPKISERREQIDKWEKRLVNQQQYLRWKDTAIKETNERYQSIGLLKKEIQDLHHKIENINWMNPLKIKENLALKERTENQIGKSKDFIKAHEEKLNYYREKLGFTSEKEFRSLEELHKEERPGQFEKIQKQQQQINLEREVLQKAEIAHKNAFVRQVASNYPDRPEMKHMPYSDAQKLNSLNKQNGKVISISNIENKLNSRKQEIEKLQGKLVSIEIDRSRLGRAENYLKNFEKHHAVVDKYENNPFLKGKILVSKTAKQEYEQALSSRETYKNLMNKEGVTDRADFQQQTHNLVNKESQIPEVKSQIQSAQTGLGLLDSIMKGIEHAGRQMQREKERQERERQRVQGKEKGRGQDRSYQR